MAARASGGIHIVTCNDPSCAEMYSKLCQDLEKNDVVCVEEGRGDYGLGAYHFHEKFKEKVDSTLYTVIHLCPEMIDKLVPVQYLLEDTHYRGKFVYINTRRMPTNLAKYYKQATRLRLYDDSDYRNIVERLTDAVNSSNSEVSSPSQSSATGSSPAAPGERLPVIYNDEHDYDIYDDVEVRTFTMKENEVHYLNSRLQQSQLNLPQYSGSKDLKNILKYSELYTAENRGKTLMWIQTTILPKVALTEDLASIGLLLNVPIALVKEKVRESLWTILLSKEFGEIKATALKYIESTLFDLALQVKPGKDNSCEWSELICLYIVTVIHRVHLLMEQNCSLESAFERKLIMLQGDDDKCADITAFMEDFKCRPDVYIQTLRSADLKEFRKKRWHGQFLVVSKHLLEIFKGEARLKSLLDLQKFLEPKAQGIIMPWKSVARLHWLVGRLLTIGITSFFKTFDERGGEDLHRETLAAFKILKDHSEFPMASTTIMRGLIFSSNDVLRKEAIKLFMSTESYMEKFRNLALLEVSDELKPINVDITEHLTGSEDEDPWMITRVGRVSPRVMIHIHLLKEEDLVRQLKSTLTPSKCGHRNTIEILRSLREHPRILPLFAFRVEHIPVFYVTEDYCQPNLHQVLYSKATAKAYLQPVDLLELLLQALDAVDHLHKNKIVHRDITASSFLFNQKHKHVKLFKFELARSNPHQIIVDRGCSGIPVRWSAPESLSKGLFSFRSDSWMLGVLIYEVITHGALPFSDLEGKSEVEIVNLIKSGSKKLHQERCIPTKTFDTIMGCTRFNEQERLPVCEAKCKLEDTLDDYKRPGLERNRKLTEKDFPAIRRMSYDEPYRKMASEFADRYIYTRLDSTHIRRLGRNSNARYLISNIPTIRNVFKGERKLEIIETQKRQFTSAEQSSLLTEDIGGIYDHVTIVDFEDEEALSYSIPIGCTGSLHSLTESSNIHAIPCVWYLWVCAKALMKMHSRKWIHGALSSKNIWIKDDKKEQKVYFTELAYMRQSCEEECGIVSDDSEPPTEEEVYRRSAPEVIHAGTYSPACDVYSFGLVVWDVFAGVNSTRTENKLKSLPKDELYEYLTTQPESELLPRPSNCPPEIYSLVKMCWCPERHERPSMAMVFNKFNEFTKKS